MGPRARAQSDCMHPGEGKTGKPRVRQMCPSLSAGSRRTSSPGTRAQSSFVRSTGPMPQLVRSGRADVLQDHCGLTIRRIPSLTPAIGLDLTLGPHQGIQSAANQELAIDLACSASAV